MPPSDATVPAGGPHDGKAAAQPPAALRPHAFFHGKGPTGEPAGVATGLLTTLVVITLWRLWAGWMLPVTQDEAYYFDWARSLAWGYFDHPPGVAFLGSGTLLAPASAIAGRLGSLLAATLTLLVLLRLYRGCGLRGRELLVAFALAGTSLPVLAAGVLATPDTPLALAWALALHEGLAALRGERRRWLGAGLATGLGLLSKYTMVLVGPVFLWAILWADPKALRTPWPYLGGLLALVVLAPHLMWSADNDWLTIRFQFGHGFATATGTLVTAELGPPVAASGSAPSAGAAAVTWVEGLGGVLGFLGTQVALWGLPALGALVALGGRLGHVRRPGCAPAHRPDRLEPAARALLVAGTAFPVAFFALVAMRGEVEANWPLMYMATAAPLLARAVRGRWLLPAAYGNLILAGLVVVHGATGVPSLPGGHSRLLRETRGYAELAQRLAALPGPLFADRYQLVAMTRFYAPALPITQWPGLSRPSEYLRGRIAPAATRNQVERAGGFRLLTQRIEAPDIPGFRVGAQLDFSYCVGQGLVAVAADTAPPCADPTQRWRVLAYGRDSGPMH